MSFSNALAELVKAGMHDHAIKLIEFDNQTRLGPPQQLEIKPLAPAPKPLNAPKTALAHSMFDLKHLIKEEIIKHWPIGFRFTSFQLMDEVMRYAIVHNWFLPGDEEVTCDNRPYWRVKASDALASLVKDGSVIKLNGQRNYEIPHL